MKKNNEAKHARLRSIIIIAIAVALTVFNCAEKPEETRQDVQVIQP